MRGVVGLAALVAAVLASSPSPVWWAAVLVTAAWTATFVTVVLRRGLVPAVVTGEALVTGALCLLQRWILPAGALPDGVSWIAVVLTSSMVVVNFTYRPWRAVPVCVALLLCHLVGAREAGAADGGIGSAVIHVVQVVSLAVLMTLVRRAARLADDVLVALRREQEESAAAEARRREEEARSDELHNTVLATLTAVATGGVTTSTPVLREQASVAARVVTGLLPQARPAPAGPDRPDGDVALAERLCEVVRHRPLPLSWAIAPVVVPAEVAEAVAGAVEEALANVERHAGATQVWVRAEGMADGVRVEVEDDGCGFDVGAVPSHRYGVRHAVVAAMRRVGGCAVVESRPGAGTRVELRWPA
jgi:signal transduction histidine kinase